MEALRERSLLLAREPDGKQTISGHCEVSVMGYVEGPMGAQSRDFLELSLENKIG